MHTATAVTTQWPSKVPRQCSKFQLTVHVPTGVLDDPACSEVVFASNHTFAASVLWVKRSHVVLTIERGATLQGLSETFKLQRPDCRTEDGLEFNWRHWCALVRVTAERNFTVRGGGVIRPGGGGGVSPDFYSALHVQSTVGVNMLGIHIQCTAWWWCTVLHNSSDVYVSKLFLDGSTGRDGMDLVNCRRVLIEDSVIQGSDDALCFKTIKNGGLDAMVSSDVVVRRCQIDSTWCNAIQFGSATEVDIFNFTFSDIVIRSARKSAIGIITMDSANISSIAFFNVIISGNVATPLFVKIGNRIGCEDHKGGCSAVGSITDVNLTNISALGWGNVTNPKRGHSKSYTATIEGLNSTHRVGAIRMVGFDLVAPGGGSAAAVDTDPPISPLDYQPRFDGVRPSYGLFVRHAESVSISDSQFRVDDRHPDGRPAVVMDDLQEAVISRVEIQAKDCEIDVRNVLGNLPSELHICDWTPSPIKH